MTLEDLLPQYKRYCLIGKGVNPKTYYGMQSSVRKLIEKGNTSTLNQVSTKSIRDFLYDQKIQRCWTKKTFKNNRQYLKSFFDFCKREGYINKNPVDDIEVPRVSKTLPRCLKTEEIQTLLLHVDTFQWSTSLESVRNRALIRTFLFTGIRLSELRLLETIHVDLQKNEILIVKGKGEKDRIVPIHTELAPYIKAYLLKKKYPTKYLFSSMRSDNALTEKNIYRIIKKLRKVCGFHFSPHMLRHTFGKLSIEANLNPFILQRILGHSDISTTQIYVSVSSKSVQDSFQSLKLI